MGRRIIMMTKKEHGNETRYQVVADNGGRRKTKLQRRTLFDVSIFLILKLSEEKKS